MDDTDYRRLVDKVRLLATQVFTLTAYVQNIAEAVLTKDDAHKAMLIEGVEGDLGQLQDSLETLIRSLQLPLD